MLIAMLLDLKSPHSVSAVYPKNSTRLGALLTSWQNKAGMPDGEYSAVLNIDGVLVGVKTMGDTVGTVWDSVVFFEKHGCDIGVLACHNEHLQRSGKCLTSGWTCEKITKESAVDSALILQENKKMAKDLLDKVTDAVKQINTSNQTVILKPQHK